jgi:hypothetical protein
LVIEANAMEAVATPTAGVFTKAATASLEVSIFKPAGIATVAASVRLEHTTITGPAGTNPLTAITMLPPDADDEVVEGGMVMVHLLTSCAVTRVTGNMRVILSPAARALEVVKDMVALPPGPTALVIVSVGNLTHCVHEPDSEGVPPVLGTMAGASSPLENAGSALEDTLKPNAVAA